MLAFLYLIYGGTFRQAVRLIVFTHTEPTEFGVDRVVSSINHGHNGRVATFAVFAVFAWDQRFL
jgi:hypothetical protein